MIDLDEIKVSIIIPCYNSEKYIGKCFKSLENQTFKLFELIVIDDCSTDNTLHIIEEFANRHILNINIIKNDKNYGPSASRNIGLKHAKGQYIGFIDNDDYVTENYIEVLYNLCINRNADFVACGSNAVYPDAITTYVSNSYDISGGLEIMELVERFLINMTTWSTLIDKKIIKEHDIEFTNGAYEDIFFNLRAMYYCNHYVSIPNKMYYFVQHQDSLSHRANVKNYSYIDGFCTMLETIKPFTDLIQEENDVTSDDAFKIMYFFFTLMLMKLKDTNSKMDSKIFNKELNSCLENKFKDNSLYIRLFLDYINNLQKYKDSVVYELKMNNIELIKSVIYGKKIVFFGNNLLDIDTIRQWHIIDEGIFVNVYKNGIIDFNTCLSYMKNSSTNEFFIFLIKRRDDMVALLAVNGYKEYIDYIFFSIPNYR